MLRPICSLFALAGLSGCLYPMHEDEGVTAIDEPFDAVVVTVETGTVEILGDDALAPELDWTLRWGRGCPDVDMEVREGVLYVEALCPVGSWSCSTDLTLTVPTGVDVDVQLTTGSLRAEAVGAVRAELTTGDIDILGATDELALKSTTGRIRAAELDVREAWVEVTTGGIALTLDEPFASVEAELVTGNVTLEVPTGCYDLDLDVITGNIDTDGVDCGCDDEASIRARAITGSISVLGS